MKIAIVAHNDTHGGSSSTVALMADEFHSRGHKVDLVFLAQRTKQKNNLSDGRIAQISPEISQIYFPSNDERRDIIQNANRFGQYLSQNKPDVVISSLLTANATVLLGRWLALSDVQSTPIIMREITHLKKGGYNFIGHNVLDKMSALTYGSADAVVMICDEMLEGAKKLLSPQHHSKLHRIYPPAIEPAMYQRATEQTGIDFLDRRSSGQIDPPVFVNACRLATQKDLPTLINAFSIVHRANPDARLVIVGEGEQRPLLEQQIQDQGLQDHVLLPGYRENPFAFMNKATAVVNSSAYEGYCKTLAQAIALGTPVISSNCPVGPTELVEMQQGGQIFPVGDVAALADAMSGAIVAERMRGSAKVAVPDMSAHTLPAVVTALEQIGLDLVAHRGLAQVANGLPHWRRQKQMWPEKTPDYKI